METNGKPRILCVDDEPNILDSLRRQLRHHFSVETAPSGKEGLRILEREPTFTVVVSDMRMPGMDGAEFLRRAREQAPDCVRLLLTGQADLDSAISAVNDGNIFRFLTKPCQPEILLAALTAAVEQHRLVTAERVLLEQTLRGCIEALSGILGLASPAAFGRASRAKRHVTDIALSLGVADRWQYEVAAMLSQIGCITLPKETAEKLYRGDPLDEAEVESMRGLPQVNDQLLASIPRLEGVRDILRNQYKYFDGSGIPEDGVSGDEIPLGARILKVALDFDALEARNEKPLEAFDTLRRRAGSYDPTVLEAFAEVLMVGAAGMETREVLLSEVQPGMMFAEDIAGADGELLIARGQEVTPAILERIRDITAHLGVQRSASMLVPT